VDNIAQILEELDGEVNEKFVISTIAADEVVIPVHAILAPSAMHACSMAEA
jgi:hypothetical protein